MKAELIEKNNYTTAEVIASHTIKRSDFPPSTPNQNDHTSYQKTISKLSLDKQQQKEYTKLFIYSSKMTTLIGQLQSGRIIRNQNEKYTAERGLQLIEAPTLEELNKLIEKKNQKSRYAKSYPAFYGEKR